MVSPGAGSRSAPTRLTGGYLVLKHLARAIETRVREARLPEGALVLDVGCGEAPYRGFFAPSVSYVGIDFAPRRSPPPAPEGIEFVLGSAESIPVKDGSADMVLCTQVLEHARYPQAAVTELMRVLKVGGTLLLSTHGVMPVHRDPVDYWRWTDAGLEALFDGFGEVRVEQLGSTAGTLAFLVEDQLGYRLRRGVVSAALRWAVNIVGDVAEKMLQCGRDSRPLISVYLVVASKPSPR